MKKQKQNQNITTVGATSSRPIPQRDDPNHNQKGITLIALVITIIVLLILAGVTIAMITGDSGILKYSKTASERYGEEIARERLEVKLAEMQTEKIINKEEYNENEYLTEQLSKVGFGVSGDIVIVDGWQFQIDRSVPKIDLSLGKGIKNESIQIELTQEVAGDFTKSTVTIKATPIEEIKSVLLNGEELIEEMKEDGTTTKEITENKTYSVLVKDKNDNYNMSSIAIIELAENMDIWNKEDLIAFREKVNSGATFEGRTVRVMADININEKKYTVEEGEVTFEPDAEQWTPIANHGENNTLKFKGTLEGNNHKIKGLYIKNERTHQGLFGYNEGTIKDLIIEEGYIKGTATTSALNVGEDTLTTYFTATGSANIGAITGTNAGGQIINCTNKIKVEGNTLIGGIAGYNAYIEGKASIIENCINKGEIISVGNGDRLSAGGIVGINHGELKNSTNIGKIKTENTTSTDINALAGITGWNYNIIKDCTNEGEIINSGTGKFVYAGGIVGLHWYVPSQIINCANKGAVTNAGKTTLTSKYLRTGGITGSVEYGAYVLNCYNRGTVNCSGTGQSDVGGVTGLSYSSGKVHLCYNTGSVSNTATSTKRTGAISGYNNISITNCYYLSGTASAGIGAGTTTGTTAMSDANMKLETFVNTLNSLRQEGYSEWIKSSDYPVLKQD